MATAIVGPASRDDIDHIFLSLLGRTPDDYEPWAPHDWRTAMTFVLTSPEYQSRRLWDGISCIRSDKVITFRTRFGFFMPIDLREPLTLCVYVLHDYEAAESEFIHSRLRRGDVAVDIGARHGWFCGIMADKVGSEGQVYAFEPLPPLSGPTQIRETNGFSWLTVIEKGLSNAEGVSCFDEISMSMAGKGRAVDVTTLDKALEHRTKPVSLIKMDIEGAEYLALSGGRQLLSEDKPVVVMEINSADQRRVSGVGVDMLWEFMECLGYTCRGFDGTPISRTDVGDANRIFNVVFEL